MRTGAASRRVDLRRLRWFGVASPIAAVVVGELFRHTVLDTVGNSDIPAHLLSAGIAVVAIVAFALVMFAAIERAERETLRQNRELGALNGVSSAIQEPSSQEEVVSAALRTLLEATGAGRATVRVFPDDGDPPAQPITVEAATTSVPSPFPVEVPLTTGSAVVGLLQLWLPRADAADAFSPAALQNVSHQLGCAIQMRRLVDDLRRRGRESAALYDVAVQVSRQHPLADTLARIVRSVREILAVDEVRLCLTPAASRHVTSAGPGGVVASRRADPLPLASDGNVCVTLGPDVLQDGHDHRGVCPVRSSPEFTQVLEIPIRSADAVLGDIWVGRRADRPFVAGDRRLLAGLADLASIAVTSARLLENERIAATVAERDRIAHELHDSLAQVLGVAHLRLRALGSQPPVRETPGVAAEVEDLANLAEEAFRDVRETILGLRESSRLERGFVPSLSAYLDKFGRQSGVDVRLESALEGDPDLGPDREIQVIRVVQEALANVRKHAATDRATVRLSDDEGGTTIEIADKGRGFDVARTLHERDDTFGLHTMRERMELVGGSLTVDSAAGRGTRVVARVPKERQQALRDGRTRAIDIATPDPAGR